MAISNLKLDKELDRTKSRPNGLQREEKSSRSSFMNAFQKYGRKINHMNGNMA